MPNQGSQLAKINGIAAGVAGDMGFTLVDCELVRETEGFFLRFYIDKPGGITINDCEVFHKRLQPQTDDINYDYMEVSSPGADRPLKKPEDYARARGNPVEVCLYKPAHGAKRHIGTLLGLEDGVVRIETEDGSALAFPISTVSLVKPYIDFSEEDLKDDTPAQPGDDRHIEGKTRNGQ